MIAAEYRCHHFLLAQLSRARVYNHALLQRDRSLHDPIGVSLPSFRFHPSPIASGSTEETVIDCIARCWIR